MTLAFDGTVDLGRFVLDARFDCAPGETIALVGSNGSGKSTALNALAGLLGMSSGSLSMDGTPLDRPADRVWVPPERRHTGMMFQDFLLFPHLTVRDNVAYGLRRNGTERGDAERTADSWLERFGVGDLAGAHPDSLSGGQAQRVALARALAREPRLLLLDEPLSALDSETRLEVRCEIHRHLQHFDGYTVLVAHDVVDIMVLADRVVVLDDGRVAQVADPVSLERRPRTTYAAALVGTNLLRAHRRGTLIELGDDAAVPSPSPGPDGPVEVIVAPRDVSVSRPDGRTGAGTWTAPIAGMEAAGNEVHLRVGGVVPIAARATLDSLRDLHLTPGAIVQVTVDPAHVQVFDDGATDRPVDTRDRTHQQAIHQGG